MVTPQGQHSKFQLERELEAPVAQFLREESFDLQLRELPFYEYRMDLYGYSRRDGLTVAVELKLRRWARAVEQALLYQLCADLVYIAMPAKRTGKVDREVLRRHGIGLIAVERSGCEKVIASRRSTVVREGYREAYVALVSEGRFSCSRSHPQVPCRARRSVRCRSSAASTTIVLRELLQRQQLPP